jgi:hypothetical protein
MKNIVISCFYKQCMAITKRRGCINILSTVVISLVALVAPLRAEFAYVANSNFFGNTISAYRIGKNGALTPVVGSPFPTGNGYGSDSAAVDPWAGSST